MNLRTATTRALLLGSAVLFAAACGQDQQQVPTETEPPIEQVGSPGADVATALAVKERHGPDLMEIEGVVGHGLGMRGDRPVIRVYTIHGNVRGIPDHVENVPIERVVTGLITAGTTSRARPAPNGFSIGHPDITAGTFGALVQDAGGVCYALSNNHVLANSNNANIGDSALQPGPYDGGSDPADAIGMLADFEPILFDGSNNRVDAAIAEVFAPVSEYALGETPSSAYGAPGTETLAASVGLNVMKFGRTTGFETGQVEEVGVTVNVCYETRGPFNCISLARFVDQISISPGTFSAGGDSGSLIVENETGRNEAVGLLFAGSSTRTLANPISDVLNSAFATVGPVSVQPDTATCTNARVGGGGGGGTANTPPTADFTYTTDGLTANFTDASSDSDGTIASWHWNFGDNNTSTEQSPSHPYAEGGTYTVTLTVTDDDGATDSYNQDVTVTEPSTGGITLSATGYKVRGLQKADLNWDGATSTNVDIYRDADPTTSDPLVTTVNDGAYTDNINQRGSGSYTYQVCETGTSTCSNTSTVTF